MCASVGNVLIGFMRYNGITHNRNKCPFQNEAKIGAQTPALLRHLTLKIPITNNVRNPQRNNSPNARRKLFKPIEVFLLGDRIPND